MNKDIKIWLDDTRPAPDGYLLARSVNKAISLIEVAEAEGDNIKLLDLDHDLGDFYYDGGDGIKLIDYLVENKKFYPVKLHTMNMVGKGNMLRTIKRYWPNEQKYER